jgi:phosphomevalonate kinase
MEVALSAPGKLFLSGEYAILWGGTARLAGVGPRTWAFARSRDDRQVHLVLAEGRLQGTLTPLGVRWQAEPPPAPFAFAARALDVVVAAHGRESLGFSLALSPTPAGPEGHKLGLGSSARAVVLAVEAAARLLEVRSALALALLAHAEVQGGRGSGGDVAACSVGGLLRYRRWPVERVTAAPSLALGLAAAGAPEVVRLGTTALPALYAFSGQSASTPGMIARVEAALPGEARRRFVEEMDGLGQALEDGLRHSRFAQVDEACRGLQRTLATLPGVSTPATERIVALAQASGCTGKVSGAGGGDGCVLFAPDEAARGALLASLAHRDFVAVPLTLEPGLRAELDPRPELRRWLA